MTVANTWVSIRDDFDMLDLDNIAFFAHGHDAKVVNAGWKKERQGGRDWQLWSVYWRDLDDMDAAIDDLASRNPGKTKVLAAWLPTGLPYLPPAGYAVYGNLQRYMPDGALPLRDVNLLFGQIPRVF